MRRWTQRKCRSNLDVGAGPLTGTIQRGAMPSIDVLEAMQDERRELLKRIEKFAGKRGAPLLSAFANEMFDKLTEQVDWERREWEDVLNQLMQRDDEL